jgi:Na+-translocating ferredoxin:NAD+ oxidoreductase RnfE subunit
VSTEKAKKNLVRSSLVPLLGAGLCVPLFVGARPAAGALLGVVALVSLLLSTTLNALVRFGVSKNIRIGCALIITGAVFSIALITAATLHFPEQLPVASLAPLLVAVGVLAGDNPAYIGKGSVARAIIDGGLVGLCFLAGILLLGTVAEFTGKISAGHQSIPLVFILVAAATFIIEILVKLKRGVL